MPAFLSKSKKQFTANEANQTLSIAKILWVVELANRRIKTWRFFITFYRIR
jgi:hypothetical protein